MLKTGHEFLMKCGAQDKAQQLGDGCFEVTLGCIFFFFFASLIITVYLDALM